MFVSGDAEKKGCGIPPVMRHQKRSPLARACDADNPATAIDKALLKAIDVPGNSSERREHWSCLNTIVRVCSQSHAQRQVKTILAGVFPEML